MAPLTKREKYMGNSRNRDTIEPVGSVVERNSESSLPRSSSSSTYQVVGRGGSVRHTGDFSSDNAAFQQLRVASNNNDKDALYERAVNWELEQAKLREQRAYDESLRDEERAYARAVLEEQRQYDSPLEQVSRQRAAGINPDIASGGSGSTSSGSSAQMQIPDTQSLAAPQLQAQNKFNNAYDNTSQVFEGINTAVNVIGTFVGGYSQIADSIIKFRELPSRITGNTAAANLQSAKANSISELLSGDKVRQDFQNVGISIDNASKVLSVLSNMGDFLSPDSNIAPILTAMGVDNSHHDAYHSAFAEMMKTPSKQAKHAHDIVDNSRAQAEREYFTSDYFNKIVEQTTQLEELSLDFAVAKQKVDTSIAHLIENSGYAQSMANSAILDAENSQQQQEMMQNQIRHDMLAFGRGIENLKQQASRMMQRRAEILKNAAGRPLQAMEQQEIDYINDALPMIQSLGSQQLGAVFGIARELSRREFLISNNPTYNPKTGETSSLTGKDNFMQVYNVSFNDVISGAKSTWDIIGGVTDRVISSAQAIGMIALGFKGIKQPKSGQTIIDYKPSKGGWRPTSQREIFDNY